MLRAHDRFKLFGALGERRESYLGCESVCRVVDDEFLVAVR
jgi:hypothetical protein